MKHLIFVIVLLSLLSCDQNRLFEQNNAIGADFWYVDSVMVFRFDVDETDVAYNIYSNIRHSSAYKYHNLYYKYALRDSSGTELKSELVNINLFNPKTGAPQGSGLGDTFDHRQLLLASYTFQNPGTYSLSFQQYMRTDSLPEIVSMGARVEKAISQ